MGIQCPKCQSDNTDTARFCSNCATSLPSSKEIPVSPTKTIEIPTEELTTGSTFAGRYQIIEELGKGGMGKVYKAHDTEIKEKVALKLLKPEIAADEKTIERFRNEIRLARKIVHKNVGRMYDLGKEQDTYYISMEYVSGEDLKSFIRRSGQLAVGTTIKIANQVCEGLSEAHRLGVIHRDLKPQNVMIDKDGNARIMDFGIARSLKAKGITGPGVMIGTPEYMSPEQVEGKEVDQRSDIYSLGVILYEMVTGRVPFEGDTPFTIGVKHKSEAPRNPKELNSQTPDDLCSVILKCLDKEKDKRYQSVGELRAELTGIEQGIPTTERETSKKKPITSKEITVTFGLKKLLIPALVVVFIAVAVVVILKLLPQKEIVSLPPSEPSIAVLPFDDLSPQKDQEYLCDGFTESLINALTKIKGLRVPARTSSFSFRGKKRDMQIIGEKLGVETVLDGSVQKAGSRIRITAQLVKVADESLLWSEQYSRELNDIFAIQDEISLAIVDKLKLELLAEEKSELMKRYTENVEAYNLYLKGLYFWNKRTEEDIKKGIDFFHQAIENDPNFALAHAGLANSYVVLSAMGHILAEEAAPKARAAALKALEIDSTLGEAHTLLAQLSFTYDLDLTRAGREFKRAIELNPGYATAHQWYADYWAALGKLENSLDEIKRAQELDPLSPIISYNLGVTKYFLGHYEEAIEQCHKTLEMFPDFFYTHVTLGSIYLQKEMFEEAITEFQQAKVLSGGRDSYIAGLGFAYSAYGDRDKALGELEQLKELSSKKHIRPFVWAMIYTGLGEKNEAFKWLEMAYKDRNYHLFFIKVNPMFDSLRPDPRFKALLKKMNLEE
jgi:serine/threonine-protein kinase